MKAVRSRRSFVRRIVAVLGTAVVAASLPLAPVGSVLAQEAPVPSALVPVSGIPCYDDGGPRVHVFYLYATGQPDDLAKHLEAIRDAAAQTDAVFSASAARTGGVRHVRFRTTTECSLVVTPVAVDEADHVAALEELKSRALLAPGDTALAFLGPTLGSYAGNATLPIDDRPGSENASNAGGGIAAVGYSFWGDAEGPASMLARSLGAVQPTAPHASAAGHCTDGADPLCFDDLAIGEPLTDACGPEHRFLLDCGADSYFSAAPAAGSWLADHWNVASSVFLSRDLPPRTNPVEAIGVVVEGVPADGRVGPQTPLTVRVTNTQPLERVVLVSTRSPGVQPLTLTGSTASGSLRSLQSTGPGRLFAIARDKLGRERRSAVSSVSYVAGMTMSIGAASSAVRGPAAYRIDLDLSGDQTGAHRVVLFRPRTDTSEPVVLVDVPLVAGQTRYEGTIDTTALPDGDAQQLVLVLADATGAPVPGSASPVRITVSNSRPALTFDVVPNQALAGPVSLTSSVTEPVASVRYAATYSDCPSGRVLGTSTEPPYAVAYDPAPDWRGPSRQLSLCVTAVRTDGSTTTIGPVPVATSSEDSVELRTTPGTRLTIGLNKLPIVVQARSGRRLRAIQVLETTPLFGRGGHLVVSNPVPDGSQPTVAELVVPPGVIGTTELYVRAVFEDGTGEYIRSAAVPVEAVVGPTPTIRLSASTIVAGGKVLVEGTAPPGADLEMYVVSRPSTVGKLVRYGKVPLDGRYAAVLGPIVQSRVWVRVLGGGTTAQMPVNVRSVVSMTPVRTGVRTYRFSGSVYPKRAGVRVLVARRTSTGAVAFARATTASNGVWTVTHRFLGTGSLDVVAATVSDAVNTAGQSPTRQLRVF